MGLDQEGITVVALSNDTVAQAAHMKRRDGLGLTLLSDPELDVVRQFGLVHEKALPFYSFTVLGIPLGWPTGIRPMAIPTTLLVNAAGEVVWKDQSPDYMQRSDPDYVRSGLAKL